MRLLPLGLCALLISLFSCSQKPSLDVLKKMAATEKYPEDQFLDTVSNKKALVVVAHDDDDCAMSGTIEKLKAAGWTVQHICFVTHLDVAGTEKIPTDGIYRAGLDTMKNPYMPIPASEFEKQFPRTKIADALLEKVNAFQPAAIFTLDNELGGYGHPEHIFISKLVYDLFQAGQLNTQRIYQSVYTDHMEKEIVDNWLDARLKKWGYPNATRIAREMYHIGGMPEPTAEVNIRPYASQKMSYLRNYPEDVRKNLRKFVPYFEEFDAETYFSVFDKEYFRVVTR